MCYPIDCYPIDCYHITCYLSFLDDLFLVTYLAILQPLSIYDKIEQFLFVNS